MERRLILRFPIQHSISRNPAPYINRAIHQPHAAAKLLGKKLRRGRIDERHLTQVQYYFLMIASSMIDQQGDFGQRLLAHIAGDGQNQGIGLDG